MSALARLLIVAVTAVAVGCAGASTGGEKVVSDGMDATGQLPKFATAKVKMHAAKCDKGDPVACDWVGVWFLVGGGGSKHVGKAEAFFKFACQHGYRRGCVHLEQMKRGDHEL